MTLKYPHTLQVPLFYNSINSPYWTECKFQICYDVNQDQITDRVSSCEKMAPQAINLLPGYDQPCPLSKPNSSDMKMNNCYMNFICSP